MIQTIIYQSGDLITGFQMTGHADAGEYGQDIVCSAASALSITTTNALDAIAGVKPTVTSDAVNGGKLAVRLPEITDSTQRLQAQTLLKAFVLGMRSIADEYSQYINLTINH